MESAIESVLDRFHARSEKEHELMESLPREEFVQRVDEFLLPIGPEAGRFLNILIKAAGCRVILEVGTSHGYSTVWLAEAARATGGKVITLDVHEAKQAYAKDELRSAGLADHVEFVLGDARETIPNLDAPIDFALLDIWKSEYIPCFDLMLPRLAAGALIAADNMLYPESAAAATKAYQHHVRRTAGMESVLVPIGNGIELTRFAG